MNKKIFWLAAFSVFFVPLSSMFLHEIDQTLMQTNLRYVQYVALQYMFPLWAGVFLWKFNRYISILIFYCLFSVACIAHQNFQGMQILTMVTVGSLGVYMISRLDGRYRKYLIWVLAGLIIFEGVYVVIQYLGFDPVFKYIFDPTRDDTVGTIGSHNHMGLFFGVMFPVILSFCPYLTPLIVFALWCSTTTSAWAGALVSTLLFLFYTKRKLLVPALALIALCTGIFFHKFEVYSPAAYQERFDLWKLSVKQVTEGKAVMKYKKQFGQRIIDITQVIKTNPWFGFGIGNWGRISPATQYVFMIRTVDPNHSPRHRYEHAHNDYVEILFEFGRCGLIALFMVIFDLIRQFAKAHKTKFLVMSFCCIVSHLVAAMGIYTVHTATNGLMLIVMLGIFYGEIRGQRYGEFA